eukprot:GHRR01016535.1.p1 GENE.GHRR01016535.1~~GHRR01016535.1.p1  ORF type:complete len:370 (+),score=93.59 GHRR01016535.1:586-1695(+)
MVYSLKSLQQHYTFLIAMKQVSCAGLPLQALPADVKALYEHSASSYNVGWSHGKEALHSGVKDIYKGSFYANPLQDTYDVDAATAQRHKSYYTPNIWPHQHLPQLESSFKDLGSLIVAVGLKLAGHCSKYVQQQLVKATGKPLLRQQQEHLNFADQLRVSSCHKARLLHYFPVDVAHRHGITDEDWCGWHLDHGALTGLTAAMYMKSGKEIPCPDSNAGLYICNRAGDVVQAAIPAGHIAYQMGQVMAIQSGGLLRATPHYVRATVTGEPGVSRNTFAVFMQPSTSLHLVAPEGSKAIRSLLSLDSGHWSPNMTFGEFAERTMHGYYDVKSAARDILQQKDVAPAAVQVAAEAASRAFDKRLELLVTHE